MSGNLKKSKGATFKEIFAALKKILARHPANFSAKFNTPDNYYVDTKAAVWKGKPIFFGAVQIKKNYVSFHLLPLYMCPELLKGISPELKKRMQGKACFNFKVPEPKLFAELDCLTEAGRERWTSKEFFPRLAGKLDRAKS